MPNGQSQANAAFGHGKFFYVKRIMLFAWIVFTSFVTLLATINKMDEELRPEKFAGKLLHRAIEWGFEKPVVRRQSVAQERNGELKSIDGFVYFETDVTGGATEDGQLRSLDGSKLMWSNLTIGDILQAISEVNVRAEPTASGQLLSILETGSCVIIAAEGKSVSELGGWVPVEKVSCDQNL